MIFCASGITIALNSVLVAPLVALVARAPVGRLRTASAALGSETAW